MDMKLIHDIAVVVLIFTTGMLVGYTLKLVMINYEMKKKERKRNYEKNEIALFVIIIDNSYLGVIIMR